VNRDILEGKWKQLRGRIHERWGRITNDELDQVEGNGDRLVGIIQERYGLARDEAERQLDSLVSSDDQSSTSVPTR